jgi:hypothetical protein
VSLTRAGAKHDEHARRACRVTAAAADVCFCGYHCDETADEASHPDRYEQFQAVLDGLNEYQAEVRIWHHNQRMRYPNPIGHRNYGDDDEPETPSLADLRDQYEETWRGQLAPEEVAAHAPTKDPRSLARNELGITTDAFLEALWQSVEAGGPHCPVPRVVDDEDAIRSFRVGDIILLDGVAYLCCDVGWEPIQLEVR